MESKKTDATPLVLARLDVRAENTSIPVVLAALRCVAEQSGLSAAETERFCLPVEEIMASLIAHAFAGVKDARFHVSFQVDGMDLVVCVEDKGLPYDAVTLAARDEIAAAGMRLVEGFADRYVIRNLGMQGRSQTIVKHLVRRPDYARPTGVAGAPVPEEEPPVPPDTEFTVRPLRRAEAVEVAQCVYDEFGYTYTFEQVYYPEQYADACERGEHLSMVAVAPNGEVAGHLALVFNPELPGTAEIAIGVVKKKYRHFSVMGRLLERTLEEARGLNLTSVMCEPVLYHPYTQKLAVRTGMEACALIFNYITPKMECSFDVGFRASVGMGVRMLRETHRRIHLPPEVLPVARDVIGRLGLRREIVAAPPPLGGESALSTFIVPTLRLGRLTVRTAGEDIATRLSCAVHEIKVQKCEVAELMVCLSDPRAPCAIAAAEALGFFCTGLFPGCADDDRLVMMNILFSTVDYTKLNTIEPFTGLLEKVRALAPDNQ